VPVPDDLSGERRIAASLFAPDKSRKLPPEEVAARQRSGCEKRRFDIVITE
jgi:hypothetical protein